ncbi:cupin domain-containing protein [Marinomonas ostreistagni]|uniref:Cupin domain-containing protein n=1 Tax=Marinomonas ostreistagni TaxID=359209 RepID=A0ABS0ZAD4_9GAMM|nr:cupin domain-containing protein [Marinomonas ostreistagni]MBJ7550610.1 cupin domain-containing protein [Marinomonas ostreistagni]
MKIKSLLNKNDSLPLEELFLPLINTKDSSLKHIISPPGCRLDPKWYDQDQDEWVTVIQGYGVIAFEDATVVSLNSGDYITIPAHTKHRVIKTSADETTVWLAMYFDKAEQ